MATYVVGDIQGCFEPFQHLLDKVQFNPDKDRLWSVGDLVNRGPDNLKTLRWFYEHRDNVTMVLGNHDLHLLAVSAGARNPSRKDNLDDILEAPDRETLIEWLHFQPLAHHESGVTMVHAGIPPLWSIEETLQRAWEVETALQGARCAEFLAAMYGNDPYVWDDQLSGLTRLRVITNYLTRMRYCTQRQTRFGQQRSQANSRYLAGQKSRAMVQPQEAAHTRRENHFWSLGIAGRHHR